MQRSVFVTGLAFLVIMANSALAGQSNAPATESGSAPATEKSSSAPATEFWVAQDPATKKCKVVEEKPDGTTKIMIGTTSYATKDEAKAAKKAAQKGGMCLATKAKDEKKG